jgi:hypothetical protein
MSAKIYLLSDFTGAILKNSQNKNPAPCGGLLPHWRLKLISSFFPILPPANRKNSHNKNLTAGRIRPVAYPTSSLAYTRLPARARAYEEPMPCGARYSL